MANLIYFLQTTLAQRAPALPNPTQRIILKEALQALVLDFLYNHPQYRHLNFYGGTCLRVVYRLNRLSEDLDLDNSVQLNVSHLKDDLVRHFSGMQGDLAIGAHEQQEGSEVMRITLRFPILFALGLSPHRDENLHLKVEISHHHQVAIVQHTPIMSFSRAFIPAHFSLETMMAGKMIACLERSFFVGQEKTIKGRDFYDLLWFMQQQIIPLEAKLAKDGKEVYTIQSAFENLQEKVAKISKRELAQDLLPLFENRLFIETWLEAFHENFERFRQFYLKI